jgi:hypothetical protein
MGDQAASNFLCWDGKQREWYLVNSKREKENKGGARERGVRREQLCVRERVRERERERERERCTS